MDIIDYHSHLPWPRDTNSFDPSALIRDMDDNSIALRMVSALKAATVSEGNATVLNLAERHPDRILASAVIDPRQPDVVAYLTALLSEGIFRAIELDPMEFNFFPSEMDALDEVFDLCGQYGVVVNVFTGWGSRTMPAQWTDLVDRHPTTDLVYLHMGGPDFGYGCVDLIQPSNRIYAETSGLYELPVLRRAFASLPPERFLFGSGYPTKISACSIEVFDSLELTATQRQALFRDNAAALLKL